MTRHLALYLQYNNYDDPDEVICEISGRPARLGGVDISHNRARGMGGSKEKDTKENLMALARPLHDFLETNPSYYWWFNLTHCAFLITRKPYIETYGCDEDPILKEIIASCVTK